MQLALLNILIITFVLLMAYYWGAVQGLFSGFLHLMAVIAAGALALAFWEPLALWLIGTQSFAAVNAWGISLLALFIAFLLVIRLALDKLVPLNVQFDTVTNSVAGGVLGFFAGVLTSGVVLIGLGFMALPSEMMGWQPLHIGARGEVEGAASDDLWMPVNTWTAGFYQGLSNGVFWPGRPITEARGDLAYQSALFRMRFDPNSSVVATPESVAVGRVWESSLPIAGLDEQVARRLRLPTQGAPAAGPRLVIVDSQWRSRTPQGQQIRGTFDSDSLLRLSPTQVRLMTRPAAGSGGEAALLAPLGAAVAELDKPLRTVIPFDNDADYVGLNERGDIALVFLAPADQEPRFLLVRGLRLRLPEPTRPEAVEVAALLRHLPGGPKGGADGTLTASGTSAVAGPIRTSVPGPAGSRATVAELNAQLPTEISTNMATGFEFRGERQVYAGDSEVRRPEYPSAETRVSAIYAAPHQQIIRTRLERARAVSIFGASIQAAKMLQPVYLQDDNGNMYPPIGFSLMYPNSAQLIRIDRDKPIQSAKELPITKMGDRDELYLYFLVPRGIHIKSYHLGQSTSQEVDLKVPE